MKNKKTIAIYGAGKLAKKLFPLLQEEFDIKIVLDKIQGNAGKRLYGVNIAKPDAQNINTWPVFITVGDVNSCVVTLKELSCNQKIFACVPYMHGFALFECNEFYTIAKIGKTSRVFMKEGKKYVSFRRTNMKSIPGRRRYFLLGSCEEDYFFSATGGPGAGLRFLWDANNRFRLIENLYVVMPGLIFTPQNEKFVKKKLKSRIKLGWAVPTNETMPVNYNQMVFYAKQDALRYFLKYAGDNLRFGSGDVYFALDPWIANAFLKAFPDFGNLVLAYHSQGILSDEVGKSHPALCEAYDAMQKEQLQNIHHWIFPTCGAADGFLKSANKEMRCLARDCDFHVLYSSYEPKETISPDASFVDAMNALWDYDVVFASATFLYKNKGVERIPRILSLFKKQTGLRVKWILVGNGEMEQEVRKSIDEFLDPEDYIWYNKRFDNQDNIFELFKRSDFYIMMHYISVSDLSTMQAMAYGCVPFLSNVGGNLEFCGFENGILIDPDTDVLPLENYMMGGRWNKEYLEKKKAYNMDIIKRKFNDYQFLSGYRDLLYSIGRE